MCFGIEAEDTKEFALAIKHNGILCELNQCNNSHPECHPDIEEILSTKTYYVSKLMVN